MIPYVSNSEIDQTLASFEHTVNFWYPTVSQTALKSARALLCTGNVDDSTSSCLAFLLMALGCAGEACSDLAMVTNLDENAMEYGASRKAMANVYMDGLLKRAHLVHMEMSTISVQCLFLIG